MVCEPGLLLKVINIADVLAWIWRAHEMADDMDEPLGVSFHPSASISVSFLFKIPGFISAPKAVWESLLSSLWQPWKSFSVYSWAPSSLSLEVIPVGRIPWWFFSNHAAAVVQPCLEIFLESSFHEPYKTLQWTPWYCSHLALWMHCLSQISLFLKKRHLFSVMIRLLYLAINSMCAKKKIYIKTLCWNALHFPQNRN